VGAGREIADKGIENRAVSPMTGRSDLTVNISLTGIDVRLVSTGLTGIVNPTENISLMVSTSLMEIVNLQRDIAVRMTDVLPPHTRASAQDSVVMERIAMPSVTVPDPTVLHKVVMVQTSVMRIHGAMVLQTARDIVHVVTIRVEAENIAAISVATASTATVNASMVNASTKADVQMDSVLTVVAMVTGVGRIRMDTAQGVTLRSAIPTVDSAAAEMMIVAHSMAADQMARKAIAAEDTVVVMIAVAVTGAVMASVVVVSTTMMTVVPSTAIVTHSAAGIVIMIISMAVMTDVAVVSAGIMVPVTQVAVMAIAAAQIAAMVHAAMPVKAMVDIDTTMTMVSIRGERLSHHTQIIPNVWTSHAAILMVRSLSPRRIRIRTDVQMSRRCRRAWSGRCSRRMRRNVCVA
jgi:hypothetical protein